MRKSTIWTTLTFAGLLAVAGCSPTISANDGAGFEALTPSAGTRQFIVANDKPFARQVAAHNATCAQQPACRK